ncbi:transposase [Oceanithermus sp.]
MNEEGYREVLAVEPAGGERKEAWRLTRSVVFVLLKGLIERGLRGVRLLISGHAAGVRSRPPFHPPGGDGQAYRGAVATVRGAL